MIFKLKLGGGKMKKVVLSVMLLIVIALGGCSSTQVVATDVQKNEVIAKVSKGKTIISDVKTNSFDSAKLIGPFLLNNRIAYIYPSTVELEDENTNGVSVLWIFKSIVSAGCKERARKDNVTGQQIFCYVKQSYTSKNKYHGNAKETEDLFSKYIITEKEVEWTTSSQYSNIDASDDFFSTIYDISQSQKATATSAAITVK
jgi:hypothetical protein